MGDLHHDKARLAEDSYLAFDAKGVVGDRAYELANAFRNPKGVEALVRDPARIERLLAQWSLGFRVAPERLLDWAVAKCALSIAWQAGTDLSGDSDLDLLEVLWRVRAEVAPPA